MGEGMVWWNGFRYLDILDFQFLAMTIPSTKTYQDFEWLLARVDVAVPRNQPDC